MAWTCTTLRTMLQLSLFHLTSYVRQSFLCIRTYICIYRGPYISFTISMAWETLKYIHHRNRIQLNRHLLLNCIKWASPLFLIHPSSFFRATGKWFTNDTFQVITALLKRRANTWGRCYDHNFLRFLPIFGTKLAFFLNTNHIFQNLALF
jgi:hypothetical protein